MTTFDVVVIVGSMCGLVMVIGGIFLLAKGIINFKGSQQDAASVSFKDVFKVSTSYPALGLFVIGLGFIIIAGYFSKPAQNEFKITGHVSVDEPDTLNVMVTVPPWIGKAYADGQILAAISPRTDVLEIRVSCPGYKQVELPIKTGSSKLGTISVGEIKLTKVADKPRFNPENITPAADNLPPITAKGNF